MGEAPRLGPQGHQGLRIGPLWAPVAGHYGVSLPVPTAEFFGQLDQSIMEHTELHDIPGLQRIRRATDIDAEHLAILVLRNLGVHYILWDP